MQVAGHEIGVVSSALQPRDMGDLVEKVRQLGINYVQLALGPLVMLDDKRKFQELGHLRNSGLTINAGMIGMPGENYSSITSIRMTGGFMPDEHWPLRKQLMIQAGKLGAELGMKLFSRNVGPVPASSDARYEMMLTRMREIAEPYAELGLSLLMETGPETAPELLQFLNDLNAKNVAVNFDPANLILYGNGDPIEAIRTLGRHIKHVHVKDAKPSNQPGIIWGQEVPLGTGAVKPPEFVAALNSVGYSGPLVIEYEAGADRIKAVSSAIDVLRAAAP
jgi:L-ribulose-5-phosphate 3-epimerase